MEERSHIIRVLNKVIDTLKTKRYVEIKHLSDQVIHQSSINQDPDIISVAVIIYSLSKLIERQSYKTEEGWKDFYSEYIKSLRNLIMFLEKDDVDRFRYEIENIRRLIDRLSGNLKVYIKQVFRKARINKASRIYEHGISMEKTAKILGISIWELAEYAGKTEVGDINLGITMPIENRIKLAEDIFR